MVSLRFDLSFFPVQRIFPYWIPTGTPRRAGRERDVLPAVHLINRRHTFRIRFELMLPDELSGFLVERSHETVLRIRKKDQIRPR